MLFRVVLFFQKAGERLERIDAPHLLGQLRNENDVEILEEVKDLVDVLVLHLAARDALATGAVGVGEDNLRVMAEWLADLVNDDGVHVDLVLGELLHQTLGLVHAQELGDADSDEGGFVDVLEALGHLVNSALQLRHLLLDGAHAGRVRSHQRGHLGLRACSEADLREQAREGRRQSVQTIEGGFKHGGEGKKAQGVSRRRSVENDHIVLHLLHLLHELREGERLVDSGDGRRQIADQIVQFASRLLIHSRNAEQLLELYLSFQHIIVTILGIGFNLHTVEIRKAVDKKWMARKLLLECVTMDGLFVQHRVPQVVGRISGNDKDALSRVGKLHSERARGRCLANASLSANEDPTR